MIQTRSESTGIGQHLTLQDALRASRDDVTIWKISYDIEDGTRVRLIRTIEGWVYENIMGGEDARWR